MSGAKTGGYVALEPGLYSVAFAGMMSGAYRVDFLSGYLSGTFITFMALRPGGVYGEEASSWLVLGLIGSGSGGACVAQRCNVIVWRCVCVRAHLTRGQACAEVRCASW